MAKVELNENLDYEYCECKTVIIGAGVSGITASVNLLNNDYEDFLIIEVDDRIGMLINMEI